MNKMTAFMRESSVARILIPMGIILIIFGICMFFINNSNKDYVKTVATVSKVELSQEAYTDPDGNEVDATYTVRVKYTVNNKEYTGLFGEFPEYKVGDKLTIYYDPSDPNNITQSKSMIIPVVITLGGVASLIGGIVSGVNSYKRYKKMKGQEEEWNNERK